MDLASAHENYVTRMLDAAKGGMKALVCDRETVRLGVNRSMNASSCRALSVRPHARRASDGAFFRRR